MNKEDFFEKYQNAIFEIAKKGNKVLAKQLIKILQGLKVEGGVIQKSPKNNMILRKLALSISAYMKRQGAAISSFLYKAFDELLLINADIFGLDADSFRTSFFETIGFTKEGKIIDKSPLSKLLEGTGVNRIVQVIVNKAIQSKAAITQLVQKVTNLFLPTKVTDPSVLVTQLVKNGGFNFLQIADRTAALEMAKEVGFTHGVYAHTAKDNTRDFCLKRLNRIYTLAVIRKWDSLKWDGKYATNHKCETDCGGYNCRGHWLWVSSSTAKALAKERNKPINSYNTI